MDTTSSYYTSIPTFSSLDSDNHTAYGATKSNSLLQTDNGVRVTRSIFLSIFIAVGFVGNSILIGTIARSRHLRSATINLFILSVGSVNIVDSSVNLPLILGASLSEEWAYGDFVCQFNACFVQMTSIVMLSSLLMLTIDRCASISLHKTQFLSLSTTKANLMIVSCWAHGLVLCIVIIIGVVPTEPYPARYMCCLSHEAHIIYVSFLSVCGYIIAVIMIICLLVRILKLYVSSKAKHEAVAVLNFTSEDHDSSIWTETHALKFVVILIIAWCLCEGPYLLLVTIDQFENNTRLSSVQTSDKELFRYAWELDMTFMLFRFSYVMVLPLLSLFWCREIWIKFKKKTSQSSIVRSTLLENVTPKKSRQRDKLCVEQAPQLDLKTESRLSIRSKKSTNQDKEVNLTNSHVPVIYATSNGLHFQMSNEYSLDSDPETTEQETTDTTLSQLTTTRKCDVFGSGSFVGGGEETSDYDSQLEEDLISLSYSPLSKSNIGKAEAKKNKDSHSKKQFSLTSEKEKSPIKVQDTDKELYDEISNDSGTSLASKQHQFKHEELPKEPEVTSAADCQDLENQNKAKKRKRKKRKRDKTNRQKIKTEECDESVQTSTDKNKARDKPQPRILPKLEHATVKDQNDSRPSSQEKRPLPRIGRPTSPNSPFRQLSDNTLDQSPGKSRSERSFHKQHSHCETSNKDSNYSVRKTHSKQERNSRSKSDVLNNNYGNETVVGIRRNEAFVAEDVVYLDH